jgi:hypothetical protein
MATQPDGPDRPYKSVRECITKVYQSEGYILSPLAPHVTPRLTTSPQMDRILARFHSVHAPVVPHQRRGVRGHRARQQIPLSPPLPRSPSFHTLDVLTLTPPPPENTFPIYLVKFAPCELS